MASRVVGVPDEHTRDAGIQADGHETSHGEAALGRSDVGDDGITNDGDGQSEEHDDASEFETVGDESDCDFEEQGDRFSLVTLLVRLFEEGDMLTSYGCRYGVGDDGPELGLVGIGGDVHVVDYGGQLEVHGKSHIITHHLEHLECWGHLRRGRKNTVLKGWRNMPWRLTRPGYSECPFSPLTT